MKSTKDMVFEYVRQNVYTNSVTHARGGVETREIADDLGKQRSNISTALNELIKEGKLIKSATRPVLYRLPEPVASGNEELGTDRCVGADGSLRMAFQQAKAAIRYPQKPLSILISAKSGCGTTMFVNAVHRYAVQNCVLSRDVPLVKINCRHYSKNIFALDEELFGMGNGGTNCFDRARGGMLFIDGFDILDARQQSRIFSFLETNTIVKADGERVDYSDVYLVMSCAAQNAAPLKTRISMIIELPALAERPMEERFDLVKHFFEAESKNLKRNVEVSAEAVRALLVTDFPYNIKELHNEILKACMNAYVRAENDKDDKLNVTISDFSNTVQRNLLELKKHMPQLNRLLGDREEFLFDKRLGYLSREVVPHDAEQAGENRPVLLYAMHGSNTAQSLSAVTNALSFCGNAYGYDLSLDSDAQTAKEELKSKLQQIDRGGGIIVIYDMGSIKTMVESIMQETDMKIRCLHIPITLIGIDAAQKCEEEGDLDTVYHAVRKSLHEQRYHSTPRKNVIITLCHTGDAGAQYFKEYIDRHSRLGIKTIALNISGRKLILKEAMELKRTYNIHAFVGTYDPKLLGIPYIPATRLLDVAPENVDRVLMFEPVHSPTVDYSRIYEYLQEELKFTSVAKLKRVLPDLVDELALFYDLDSERMQGIFIHMACVIERILSGGQPARNAHTRKIVDSLAEDYRVVAKILRRLEKVFKIIIDDDEIATLIMICKKI